MQSNGATDRRFKPMNEILHGIKGIMFYSWGVAVCELRRSRTLAGAQETSGTIWLRSAVMVVMIAIPTIVAVIISEERVCACEQVTPTRTRCTYRACTTSGLAARDSLWTGDGEVDGDWRCLDWFL